MSVQRMFYAGFRFSVAETLSHNSRGLSIVFPGKTERSYQQNSRVIQFYRTDHDASSGLW